MVIDPAAKNSNLRVDGSDAPADVVQKIIYGAGRVNIRAVWVAGRLARSRD